MNAPTGPFFVPRFEPTTGGVDFLGLRQVNLALAFECIPGINNVTIYVRPFSVVSWIFWKFHELVERSGRSEFKSSEVRVYQERVEALFTWGHVLKGVGGIPGTDAKPPKPVGGKVSLKFTDWGRSAENTSLLAAVQYGPASKTVGGLGFLNPVEAGVLQTCGKGVVLAKALDTELRKTRGYRLLNTLGESGAAPADAEELFDAWSVRTPTAAERKALREVYFDETSLGTASDIGRRSSTLSIAIAVLGRAAEPISADAVREGMVNLRVKNRVIRLTEELMPTWHRWAVLQLRQTQRIALEALLAWAEWQIISRGVRTTEALADIAVRELKESTDPEMKGSSLESVISSMFAKTPTAREALLAGMGDKVVSIFNLRYRLQECVQSECENAVALAVHTLLVCARLAELFDLEEQARSSLAHGGPQRISLRHWASTVRRIQSFPLRRALLHVIENFVLSQHFAVAVSRFDGATQRLRISIEEEGLRPLVGEPWVPVVSPDRLDAALWLASDCGLIHGTEDGLFSVP